MTWRFFGWLCAEVAPRDHRNRGAGLVGLAAAAMVAGCATVAGDLAKDSPAEVKQAVVKERVKARWEALKNKDIDGSYAFLSPASRTATTLEMYRARVRPTDWKSVTIDAVDCEAEICKVKLQVIYDFRLESGKLMQGIRSASSETWIIEKGTAWYVWGV